MQAYLKSIVDIGKITLSNADLSEAINEILIITGKAVKVDRVYIFQSISDTHFNCKHQWVANGILPILGNSARDHIRLDEYNFIKDVLITSTCYSIHTKDIINNQFRESIQLQGVLSLLFIPIVTGDSLWGYIRLDACYKERKWTQSELYLMQSVANHITILINHKSLEQRNLETIYKNEKLHQYYLKVLNNIPADIVVFKEDHTYEFINDHAVKDKNVREWLIGKDDFTYCKEYNKPIKIATVRRKYFYETSKIKKEVSYKEAIQAPSGEWKTFLRIMHPVIDEAKGIEHVIGYGIDITTLIHTENRLLKLEEAIDNSPDGIALLTKDGIYTYMNRAHEAIFGYNKEELIGKSWQVLYNKPEVELITNEIFPLLSTVKHWEGEIIGKSKQGKPISQEVKLKRLSDETLLCITRDISNIKQYILLLTEANKRLDLAIRVTKLAMWEWNIETDVLRGNDIFNQLVGCENEYNSQLWLSQIHPDDKDDVAKNFIKTVEGSINFVQSEYRLLAADQTYHWILDTGTITKRDNFGMPIQMMGCMLDITELKRARIDIFNAFNKQRELLELKSKFVAMASHEFKTPLANIRSTSELIQLYIEKDSTLIETKSAFKIHKLLSDIVSETEKMNNIITDIFTIGKIENNSIKPNKTEINVIEYLSDYLTNKATGILKRHKINFKHSIREDAYINIDLSSMNIVLNNIISNSVKYAPNNLTIDVEAHIEKKYVKLSVTDYGMGIPKKDLNFIFDNFYRSSNVKNITGIGLGLVIAKHLAEINEARISIDSVINEYTTLCILIPLSRY